MPQNNVFYFNFKKNLSTYLERVVTYPPYRDHPVIVNKFKLGFFLKVFLLILNELIFKIQLLGVSPLSFTSNLGPSLIEDMLMKKSGDILLYGNCLKSKMLCQKMKVWHEKRWFCLKDTYLVYMNPSINYSISFVMLVDSAFDCEMKITAGAYYAIQLKNMERRMILKCRNSHHQQIWYDKISTMLEKSGKYFFDKTYLTYDSFAPQRSGQMCRWYING